jgi:mannonate dehydratase
MTWRWYGPDDPVSLADARQIPGMAGTVSACYDVPPGQAWTQAQVDALAERCQAAGLPLVVAESVPVSEAVKLGWPERDAHADAYCATLERLGAVGVGVVCYNFMPVFDWTRTDLAYALPDGSQTLAYDPDRMAQTESRLAQGGLPGWLAFHDSGELARLRAAYAGVSDEQLWEHLAWFLERVAPAAQAAGVRLAIHPDDPPWPVFGLPRIITNTQAMRRVCGLVDSPASGVTMCTGSLGADPTVDLPALVRALGPRVHFAHLRSVHVTGPQAFHETAHPDGSTDLAAVVRALVDVGFDGPVRPDHGRRIWSECERSGVRPGYGLYDRALGAAYLRGLWDATPSPA